jgi:hypothetical protein
MNTWALVNGFVGWLRTQKKKESKIIWWEQSPEYAHHCRFILVTNPLYEPASPMWGNSRTSFQLQTRSSLSSLYLAYHGSEGTFRITRHTALETNISTLRNKQTQGHYLIQRHTSQHVPLEAQTPALSFKNLPSTLGSRTAAFETAAHFAWQI